MFILAIELALATLAGFAFVILYWRYPWIRTPAGRHMMAISLVMSCETLTLFLLVLKIHLSINVFLIGYGLIDLVVIQRLVLFWRTTHTEEQDQGGSDGMGKIP